jgi:hypothetical protein
VFNFALANPPAASTLVIPERVEDHMSARNGQRARFHRNRKRRVVRLMRIRTVMAELLKKTKKAAGAS